jgi:peptide deformylase
MAIRDMVTGTDNPELCKISREVRLINKHVLTLLDDMKETLHAAQGVGLPRRRWACCAVSLLWNLRTNTTS